jgi:OPT family oligopeptide transporter
MSTSPRSDGPSADPLSPDGDRLIRTADGGIEPLPDAVPLGRRESHWYLHVYRGDGMKQLSIRAVLMGGIIGMLMSIAGLYTTLKIGWAFGVAITACVISFVTWNVIRIASFKRVSQMTILENNCMQSTASAAGYSTGATIATAFGAMLLLTNIEGVPADKISTWDIQPWWIVAAFTFFTGALGVFLAIPMKRQMINRERLAFPSGVAAAETLRALYSQGRAAMLKAYALVLGLAVGAFIGIANTGEGGLKTLDRILNTTGRIPESIGLPHLGFFKGASPAGLSFDPSGLLIAGGMIVGLRVSLSMLAGSILLYFVVGPQLVAMDQGAAGSGWTFTNDKWVYDAAQMSKDYVLNIDVVGGGTVVALTRWSLWGGTSLMVFASLAALALQWKTIVASFAPKRTPSAPDGTPATTPTAPQAGRAADELSPEAEAVARRIEVPKLWFFAGFIPMGIGVVIVNYVAFNMHPALGALAVIMSFALSVVACRATGETDTNPIGAMGKVMQLLFAILPGAKGNQTINLMSAATAANSASSSADLLTDLRSGYLLGANPRQQFIAQFAGIFFGTVAIVPAWYLLVPNKQALEDFNPPATNMWKAVAEVLAGERGLNALPDSAKMAMLIGALVGIALPVLERLLPKSARAFMPSAMGLGLAWVVTFGNSLGFTIGAIIAYVWSLLHKRTHESYNIPIASGLVAGESLIKALLAMLATAAGIMGWGI